MTRKDDYPMPDALVLSVRRLISDAAVPDEGSGAVAPLVLQASQRVAAPPCLEPLVLTRVQEASVEQADPEPSKPEAPLSHDPEYLEVIANLRLALAGPMRDELSSAVRTMIDDRDP